LFIREFSPLFRREFVVFFSVFSKGFLSSSVNEKERKEKKKEQSKAERQKCFCFSKAKGEGEEGEGEKERRRSLMHTVCHRMKSVRKRRHRFFHRQIRSRSLLMRRRQLSSLFVVEANGFHELRSDEVRIHVGSGSPVFEVAAAVFDRLVGDSNGTASVGDSRREVVHGGGFMATSQASLVSFAVHCDMLGVFLRQFVNGLINSVETS